MISMWGSMWNNFKLFQGSLTRGYPQGPMYIFFWCTNVRQQENNFVTLFMGVSSFEHICMNLARWNMLKPAPKPSKTCQTSKVWANFVAEQLPGYSARALRVLAIAARPMPKLPHPGSRKSQSPTKIQHFSGSMPAFACVNQHYNRQ